MVQNSCNNPMSAANQPERLDISRILNDYTLSSQNGMKIESELHGDMQRYAEMTYPSFIHNATKVTK